MEYNLYEHQKRAVAKARGKSYCIFHECGLGKSISAYELVKDYDRVMIVCPKLLIPMWQELLPNAYVINPHKLIRRAFEPSATFDCLVVDESQCLKNPKSKISKMLFQNKKRFKYIYLLSGTAAPNSDMEFYGQLRLITNEIGTEQVFYRRFFRLARQGKTMEYPARAGDFFKEGWKPYTINKEVFKRYVSQFADFRSKEECLDLPKKLFINRTFELSKKEQKAHDEMKKHLVTIIDDHELAVENEFLKLNPLRQFTSGFKYVEDEVIKLGNTKLEMLLTLLDELGNEQVIIWTQYRYEQTQIIEAVKGGELLNSETAESFKNGEFQYLIAHPKSGGTGLTFTNCRYAIYYSRSFSLEEYAQSQDRIHRISQERDVTIFNLMAKDSVDELINDRLNGKALNLKEFFRK